MSRKMALLLTLVLLAGLLPALPAFTQDPSSESVCLVTDADVDYAASIQTCIDSGHDVIITVGTLVMDATLTAAQANPEVQFIAVGHTYAAAPPNLVSVQIGMDDEVVTSTATVTTANLNVRSGPGTDHDIINVISRNSSYPILNRNADGSWVQIDVDGTASWVSADWIKVSSPDDNKTDTTRQPTPQQQQQQPPLPTTTGELPPPPEEDVVVGGPTIVFSPILEEDPPTEEPPTQEPPPPPELEEDPPTQEPPTQEPPPPPELEEDPPTQEPPTQEPPPPPELEEEPPTQEPPPTPEEDDVVGGPTIIFSPIPEEEWCEKSPGPECDEGAGLEEDPPTQEPPPPPPPTQVPPPPPEEEEDPPTQEPPPPPPPTQVPPPPPEEEEDPPTQEPTPEEDDVVGGPTIIFSPISEEEWCEKLPGPECDEGEDQQ